MAIAQLAQNIAPAGYPGKTCSVCHALETIPTTEAEALTSLLANKTLRYSHLADLLRDDPDTPLEIAPQTLARHATGRCAAGTKLR